MQRAHQGPDIEIDNRILAVIQSAVALLCELGSPEDAVALALTTDMGLATSVAARSDEDPLRQRHLWIAIARDVVSRPAPEVAADDGSRDSVVKLKPIPTSSRV